MKGAYMRPGGGTKSKRPLAHFFGGLVCESYCANIMWMDAGIYKCCNSVSDYPGFTTAGAGKDKKRAFNMKDGFFL